MATIGELEVLLRLRGLQTVKRDLNTFQRTIGRLQRSLVAFAGVAIFRQISRDVLELAKTTGDLDRQLSDVARTTGLADDELTQLRLELGDLSTVMAGSISDFCGLATTAGRAGITSREEINKLAVTAGQFAKISRQSFDSAAQDLIRLSRAFGAAEVSENLDEISDSLVLTAKRFAVSERELVDATQRTTAAIGALNLSIPETIVLMGAITERIGKARKAGTEFNSAIFKASTRMNKFAEISGRTEEELTKIIDEDAMAGVIILLQSLRDAAATSTDRLSILKDVVGEVGAKAIAPLIPQLDQLFKTMNEVSEAVEAGGATSADYAVVMDNLGEKIELANSAASNLRATVGFELAPAFEVAAESTANFLNQLTQSIKQFGLAITVFDRALAVLQGIGRIPLIGGIVGQAQAEAIQTIRDSIKALFEDIKGGSEESTQAVVENLKEIQQANETMAKASVVTTTAKTKAQLEKEKALAMSQIQLVSATAQLSNALASATGKSALAIAGAVLQAVAEVAKQIVLIRAAANPLEAITAGIKIAAITAATVASVQRIKQAEAALESAQSQNIQAVTNVPQLAEGGIVRKPTFAQIGEAGPEAVVPLDKAGMLGGMTVNINADVVLADDDAAVDRFVRDISDGLVRASQRRTGGTTIQL